VRFVGTGEAFDPSLPNTSVLYAGRQTLLLDCGYGVPHAWWRLDTDPNTLDGVFLTHRHADHCFGLPALVVWMRIAGRQRPLRLLGGAGSSRWIREVLELGYEGAYASDKCFPLEFVEIVPGTPVTLAGVELSTAVSRHGTPNHAVRLEADGRALCYSGDGAPTDATRGLFAGCSVLVHECYRTESSVGGHAAACELLPMARDARVETLCLVHIEHGAATRESVAQFVSHHSLGQNTVIPAPGDVIQL
jgi:ribonuclease Z